MKIAKNNLDKLQKVFDVATRELARFEDFDQEEQTRIEYMLKKHGGTFKDGSDVFKSFPPQELFCSDMNDEIPPPPPSYEPLETSQHPPPPPPWHPPPERGTSSSSTSWRQ